jgi:carbonic anhydrase
MRKLKNLFENNQAWAREMRERDPDFFRKLVSAQRPEYLWIGCADSRVPANQITGLLPGEVFVHRNVANLAIHTDMSFLSVLQYAVEVLEVKHIIVCGHYGCGGVRAAMDGASLGLIDNWLRNIKDIYVRHREELEGIADMEARARRLCERNVAAQVKNVCHTTVVQDAWQRGQSLTVHGWIYDLDDGLLRELDLCVDCQEQLQAVYRIYEHREPGRSHEK